MTIKNMTDDSLICIKAQVGTKDGKRITAWAIPIFSSMDEAENYIKETLPDDKMYAACALTEQGLTEEQLKHLGVSDEDIANKTEEVCDSMTQDVNLDDKGTVH